MDLRVKKRFFQLKIGKVRWGHAHAHARTHERTHAAYAGAYNRNGFVPSEAGTGQLDGALDIAASGTTAFNFSATIAVRLSPFVVRSTRAV